MKTIYLDGNIDDFVVSVASQTTHGNDVIIGISGCNRMFRAIVYAGSSLESVRRTVISKLRVVKNYETNIRLLQMHIPTEVLERYLHNSNPEDVAELCLEEGLLGPCEPTLLKHL